QQQVACSPAPLLYVKQAAPTTSRRAGIRSDPLSGSRLASVPSQQKTWESPAAVLPRPVDLADVIKLPVIVDGKTVTPRAAAAPTTVLQSAAIADIETAETIGETTAELTTRIGNQTECIAGKIGKIESASRVDAHLGDLDLRQHARTRWPNETLGKQPRVPCDMLELVGDLLDLMSRNTSHFHRELHNKCYATWRSCLHFLTVNYLQLARLLVDFLPHALKMTLLLMVIWLVSSKGWRHWARADKVEADQAKMRQQISAMEQTLAMAEAAIPCDVQKLATWDRTPDPTVFSIGAPRAIAPAAVKAALAEWIQASGVPVDQLILHGDVPQRRFHLQVQGGAAAHGRALALSRALKTSAGFRTFSGFDTGGVNTPIYVSGDKSPKQVRLELQTKRLQRIIQDAYHDHHIGAQRSKGIVTIDAVPLVMVEVKGPDEPSKLRWDMPILARFKVDKQPLVAAFGQAFASVDTSTWRRKAKMNKLVSFMRKKAVILLQECRGTLPKLQAAIATYPYPYKIFYNHLSQKAGGTAFLVPLADRDQEDPQVHFDHQILAAGRVALLTIYNSADNFTMKILNVHNFELDIVAQSKIAHSWKEMVQWNIESPVTRAFVAAGDFNVKSGPTRSYTDPVSRTFSPGTLPAETARGTQPLQAFWERLFAMVTEISTDCPTHYCRDTSTAATLDRFFIAIPAYYLLDVEVIAEVDIDAAAISDSRLSDHTPITLHLRDRTRQSEQTGIPEHVFRDPRYGEILGQLLDAAQLHRFPAVYQWRCMKDFMSEAARQVRNELQRMPISAKDPRAKGGRLITLRAISRCVWRNDVGTAYKLMATTADGARFLAVSNGCVELGERQEFGALMRAINFDYQQRE
ncbi:unnamed protein product, partial [Prorocentrum cordatum]